VHIGFVTTESPYGERSSCGVAAYLRALIPALVASGQRVSVFANSHEERDFETEAGQVSVHHFRLPSTHWYAAKVPALRSLVTLPLRQLEWSAAFYRRVARIAAHDKIDVLESSEAGALFLDNLAPFVLRLHGSELTFRRHAGMPVDRSVRWNDSLEAYVSRRAFAITTPSHFQANEITRRRGWTAERVRVIPNPVSSTMLNAGLQFARNGGSEQTVLYTGRLAPVKGIETLLAAAQVVHERNPAITFVLAGPWQMPHAPETYGLELNQESVHGVKWVGPQDQSELIGWYKRAGLFVMPSYYESFGISVLEAMAFGLPVVCSRAGGIPETVADGVTGMLFEPGNSAQLAATIAHLFDDKRHRSSLGRAGQGRDFDEFQPANIARRNLEVYAQACESVRPGSGK
jgi:glycosyltransferase involved in cell wall biosynthesis